MWKNPIYERERRKAARSSRFSVIFFLFNFVLCCIALLSMAFTFHRVAETGELPYVVFLRLFSWIAWIEFAMVLIGMPARTAACIVEEKEKKTFDILMTTCMRPSAIVAGNLSVSFSFVFLVLFSGFPVFATVLLYGGIRFSEICLLVSICILTALFVGSMGVFFSAVSPNTMTSMAMTYGAISFCLLAPYALHFLAGGLSYASAWTCRLFLFSPIAVFHAALAEITGEEALKSLFFQGEMLKNREILAAGMAVQLLLAMLFLRLSNKYLSPVTKTKSEFGDRIRMKKLTKSRRR